MLGCGLGIGDGSTEERPDLPRCRLTSEDRHTHGASRVVIQHDSNPPTKGPALRKRKGEPGCPQSAVREGHHREIDVPNVIGICCGDDPACFQRLSSRRWWSRRPFFLQNTTDRGGTQVQTGSAEHFGDLYFAKRGTEYLKLLRAELWSHF
jgi:hypothetical protein